MNEPCAECGEAMVYAGEMSTSVGYYSPPGHNHDDNCRTKYYRCKAGHERRVSVRNRCRACEWAGKATCFCHPGEKVDEPRAAPLEVP